MLRRPRRRFWGALLALKTDDYTAARPRGQSQDGGHISRVVATTRAQVLLADAYYCLAYIALLLPHWMGAVRRTGDGSRRRRGYDVDVLKHDFRAQRSTHPGHAGNQFDGGGWAAIPVCVKAVCGVCALMQARETRSTFPKAE